MKIITVLPANGKIHPVSKEVYAAFYKSKRRYKYMTQEAEKGKMLSYEKAIEDHLPLELLSGRYGEDVAQAVENKLFVEWLLQCLNDEERNLIRLYYFSGWTQQEIADNMGVSQNAINKRLHKTIKKIKLYMKNGC